MGEHRKHFLEPWSVVRSISGLWFLEEAPGSGCPLGERALRGQQRNPEGQRMSD